MTMTFYIKLKLFVNLEAYQTGMLKIINYLEVVWNTLIMTPTTTTERNMDEIKGELYFSYKLIKNIYKIIEPWCTTSQVSHVCQSSWPNFKGLMMPIAVHKDIKNHDSTFK